jgi:hypothetical protein
LEEGVRQIHKVQVELGYDFTQQELEQVASWLAASPQISVYLSDLHRGRGFKLRAETLELFHRNEGLYLYLESLKNLEFLHGFTNLHKLIIMKVHKACDLENLGKSLPTRELGLSSYLKLPSLNILNYFPQLERFELNGLESIANADALFNLKNLRTLICSRFRESTARIPLERLTSLERLSCNPKNAAELRSFARFPNLKEISVWLYDGFQASDFDCFKNHPTLEAVNVSGIGWAAALKAVCMRLGLKEADPRQW